MVSVCAFGPFGCSWPRASLDSPDPGSRIDAIADAAARRDESAVPALIGLLDSDDPAVRLASIRALERITGQTLGYEHAAREPERREKIELWVRWYEERRASSP